MGADQHNFFVNLLKGIFGIRYKGATKRCPGIGANGGFNAGSWRAEQRQHTETGKHLPAEWLMMLPSLSSLMTITRISSPTFTTSSGFTFFVKLSSRTGTIPSDFPPISTRTSSSLTFTTVPVKTGNHLQRKPDH